MTDKFFPFEMKKELFFDQFVSDFFEAEEPLGLKRQVHDLDSIRHSSLWQDWDVSRKVIDIYQARMNIISAVGHLVPRFSAGIEIAAKIKFTNSLENLFGFVVPFNWFILFQRLNLLGAERYALMDMLLDEYTLAEINYYDAHKLKWDFAIKVFFYRKILELLDSYPEADGLEPMYTRLQVMKSDIIKDKITLKTKILPNLAYQVNAMAKEPIYNFDIDPIDLPSLDGKKSLDMRTFLDTVINNSMKLESYRRLRKAAANGVGATLLKTVVISDTKQLGFSLGLDTFSDALLAKGDYDSWHINLDELKLSLQKSLTGAIHQRNIALELYEYQIHQALPHIKKSLEMNLEALVRAGRPSLDFYWATLLLKNNFLSLNYALHEYLKATTLINRLLVSPQLEKIEGKFIPNSEHIRSAKLGVNLIEVRETKEKDAKRYRVVKMIQRLNRKKGS